ncbi:hypothetical protein LINPERHAP2_LOCUS13942 [Linum perenne]
MFSFSNSHPKIFVTIVTMVAVLLLSTIPPSSAQATYTAHIVNSGANDVILVRCKSNDNQILGDQSVLANQEATWTFKATPTTSCSCYVAPNRSQQRDFVVFGPGSGNPVMDAQNNFFWVIKADGIYKRNPMTKAETLAYPWA